jgi:hypothetical protein
VQSFNVRSTSNPDTYHQVHIDGDEADCTCTAASFNRACKHVRLARELMAAEAEHATIYEAMAAAYEDCGYVQKKKAADLNYKFAGERAMIEEIRPAMVKHGIFVYPTSVREVKRETYQTSKGSTMNLVGVVVTYQFAHSGGTGLTVEVYGEGADVGDKAAPKAMTGAFKYALRQAFCIETGDDPDNHASDEQERRSDVPQHVMDEYQRTPEPRDTGPRDPNGPPDWDAFWKWAKPLGHTSQSLGGFINKEDMRGATEAQCQEVVRIVTEQLKGVPA